MSSAEFCVRPEARDDERTLLARLTDFVHPADELDTLAALIEG